MLELIKELEKERKIFENLKRIWELEKAFKVDNPISRRMRKVL